MASSTASSLRGVNSLGSPRGLVLALPLGGVPCGVPAGPCWLCIPLLFRWWAWTSCRQLSTLSWLAMNTSPNADRSAPSMPESRSLL